MAAYAALVSLMNIIHDIQRHHSPPISLDPQQLQSLTQVLTFLQELFLEAYNSPVADGDEADPLEMRITDAAYAAEDVIESHIVDNIRLQNQQTSSPADSDEPDSSERLRAVGAEDVIESRIVEMLRAVVAERQLLEMARPVGAEDVIESQIVEMLRAVVAERVLLEMVRAVGAQDVIESQIVDKIHLQNQQTSSHADSDEPDISEQISGSFNCFRAIVDLASKISGSFNCFRAPKKPENVDDEQIRSINFYQDLQRVIEEMDSIKLAAMKIDTGKAVVVRDRDVSASAAPLRSSSYSSDMVYPEAVIRGIMDKLTTRNSHMDLQVIPIVGMGGIGKTTLARNIYACKLIQEHFPVCAWATVSQQYNTREILCEVFSQATKKNKEELIEMSEATLGTELRKYLYGRKFLIVLDDMWSIDAWENIKHFFPNNKNDSRILVY